MLFGRSCMRMTCSRAVSVPENGCLTAAQAIRLPALKGCGYAKNGKFQLRDPDFEGIVARCHVCRALDVAAHVPGKPLLDTYSFNRKM